MVRTRSQRRDKHIPVEGVEALQKQVLHLTQENKSVRNENTSLLRQLHIMFVEYDELKKSIKHQDKYTCKKMKTNHGVMNKHVILEDLAQIENRSTLSLAEYLFPSECASSNHSHLVGSSENDSVISNLATTTANPKTVTKTQTTEKHKIIPPTQSNSSGSKVNVSARRKAPTQSKPRVVLIGTSMVRDTYLSQGSVNGITYCYPGQTIPFIRDRVKYILEGETPDVIVLQCGGNDLEKHDNNIAIVQYDKLIKTVRQLAPNATIVVNAIPPRGSDPELNRKIKMFNTYLGNCAKQFQFVEYFYNVPFRYEHFKKDLIHFNPLGSSVYTHHLSDFLNYLHSFPKLQIIRLT